MLRIRVIPCLLLKDQGLVKTVKFKNYKYVGCPINAVKIFNDKEVDELVFLDITATIENHEPPFKLLAEIATECFMPFGYGGGIKTIETIKKIFSLGAEKVIINSHAVENPFFIRAAAELYGSQSIVVSIDVKKNYLGKYEVFTQSGRINSKLDPAIFAQKMQKMGAGEIFLNSVNRDGTMGGYDIELIKKVTSAVDIPVIACGGAGQIKDFQAAVKKGGASAVAGGSFFVFQGQHRAVLITYPSYALLENALDEIN